MKGIGENLGRGDGMISLPPIVMAYLNMFFDINRTALLLLYIEDFNPGGGVGGDILNRDLNTVFLF